MESVNDLDFSKLVNELDSRVFGTKMHQRLVEYCNAIINKDGTYNIDQLNQMIITFPRFYSWAIVECELISEALQKADLMHELWYKEQYMRANERLSLEVKKPTINQVESKVLELSKLEVKTTEKELTSQGVSEAEIKKQIKYKGYKGQKLYLIEIKVKYEIAKQHVRLLGNQVSLMQTLSKNITTEMGIAKGGGL